MSAGCAGDLLSAVSGSRPTFSVTRAKAVALDHTGGGKVTDTEAGDEEGAYEVEVTLDDGSQVDVHLDKGFNVLSQADDSDQGGEGDSGDKD